MPQPNRDKQLPVSQNPFVAFDLRDAALIPWAIAPGIVTRTANRNVREMPRRGIRPVAPDFIGPGGYLHHPGSRIIGAKQLFDLDFGCWRQLIGGNEHNDPLVG